MRGMISRRSAMAGATAVLAGGAATSANNQDAALIRLCAQHIANRDAYDRLGGILAPGDDPLWLAYERTRNAISGATPRTLEGMLAKALAAKEEARLPDGSERPADTPAADWAWDLVNDLIRLAPMLAGGAA